jgi:drug/metabolite transporter (DMT)-like permease
MWILASTAAAILWGFAYAISDRFLKEGLTPSFLMFFHATMATPLYGLLAFKFGKVESQITILKANPKLLLTVVGMVFCYLIANLLVFWSIKEKNATVVNLIEISYPLFTAAFAWILFNQIQMNAGIAFGAVMIIAGVFCVGYFGGK